MKKNREIGNQKIWLKKDDNIDGLHMGNIVITNPGVHKSLFSELEDKKKLRYITSEKDIGFIFSIESPEFTDFGAIIYEYKDEEGYGRTTHTIKDYYYNTLSSARNLLLGDLKSEDLLDLFQTSYDESESSKLKSYYDAQELIRVLKTSSLDNEIKRRIIENLWPNFAFYAFNGLICTDINIEKTYSLEELGKTLDLLSTKTDTSSSQELKDILSKSKKEIEEILSKNEVAQRNSEILKLAQKTNLYFGQEKNNDREKESESNLSLILKNKQ
ncbi:MAG: hypothetical protein IJB83_04175 [Bacilli bacterium]|nr:hypothetical protein [Bacilli bacterium]